MKLLYRMGVVVAFVLTLVLASNAAGQSLTLGSIAGRVIDPAGAVIPNASVVLKNLDTGEEQATTTNGEGTYRFNLLKPGHYQVTVTVSGFAKTVQSATALVGQTTEVNFALELSKAAETIEVSGAAPLISTEPGVATSYTPEEVALLPTPGGDMTSIAFTAPGVVVAQGSGYGNFTVNGLPGTSNLYTVNGENDMDPYFNINNSGATNLTLGANEVQEATVVTNPYSGQYGQLSGAQVNYVTKSGTNAFHGNAQWWWNGRDMNSNDFFNDATGAPRPFSNANQWAASVGGPVWKDHTWFFVDTEGMRFIIPVPALETIPTQALQTAILNNITTLQPNELPMYTSMFNIYNKAAAGKTLTPVPVQSGDECDTLSLTGWVSGSQCANSFISSPDGFAKEWILAGRVDQKLTSKDDLYFRFKLDYGLQPTTTDPLSSSFNADSNQPAWDYQLNWRRVFNANMTNSLSATVSHYVAQFTQDSAAVNAEFPYGGVYNAFNDGFSSIDAQVSAFPQGRNITQYQIFDDFSWAHGRQTFKFGENFRRYDVSDHNFFNINPLSIFYDLSSPTLGPNGITGMQAYANGLAYDYEQQYSPSTDVPIAIWGIGFYGEDQIKVAPNFTLMVALRFEHNANPVCNKDCLSNFTGPFDTLASITSGDPANVPYSEDFNTHNHSAFPGTDAINVSPRLAFSWSPNATDHFPWFPGNNKTVISGGAGIFYDNPAAGTLDNLLANPPQSVLFNIAPLDANGYTKGIAPFTQGPVSFSAASAAFNVNDSYNQLSQILNPIIGYTPPISPTAIIGTIHSPQAQEWNLKVDQEVSKSVAVSVAYNGNHSINIPYFNNWWNTVSLTGIFADVPGMNPNPAANYGTVRTLQSGANSNYNGVTGSVRLQYHSWLMAHFNYTFSHTLDEVSNGGLFPIGNDFNGAGIQQQINPGSLRANNYGNADYDIRNLFSADYVVTPPVHFENKFAKAALGGWQWSGKVIARSGLPYSILDNNTGADLLNGGIALADIITGGANQPCGVGAAYTNTNATPCANPNAFATGVTQYTAYPNQTRNQFRGPNYVDFDMGLYKTFAIKERMNFGLGATAFNVFNHPNFNLPNGVFGTAYFGQITSMQGVPTSPYGNFLGFDSSVRVVQLALKLTF